MTIFLAASYALGAPIVGILEYRGALLSQRFDYPPALIYLTAVIQALCVAGVLIERLVPRATAALSIITVGAVVSHLRIGSPHTAIPAVVYTLLQVWLGLMSRPAGKDSKEKE